MYTLSEAWLTSNTHQINYVRIPGLQLLNRNGSIKEGGGVASYVRGNIEIKPGDDLSNLDSYVETLWFEIKGKIETVIFLLGFFISQILNLH